MSPAKKRARTYDLDRTGTAVLAQLGHLRDGVRQFASDRLALPTGLDGWTVRELLAHVASLADDMSAGLERPEPEGPAVGLLDWPSAAATRATAPHEQAEARAAAEDPDALLTAATDRLAAALSGVPGERLVTTRLGPMRLVDLLVTRTVELTVHTDDVNRAAQVSVPLDRQAVAAAVRLLADALAAKAPGASTEVRIPPHAVVQCVEGPRHTRGTPPNVVETDPLTWLRLATGRETWLEALAAARVSASGERADLSALLPLMG
jgi:uncharacterized protein (TIGR03083 family)